MADFNIAQNSAQRSFVQNSNSSEGASSSDRYFYLLNPASFAPGVYSGVYNIQFNGPSTTGIPGDGGSDAFVLRLADANNWLDQASGNLLKPLIFPTFVPVGGSNGYVDINLVLPNRQLVNGTRQQDLTVALRNFDLVNDQIRFEITSDVNGYSPTANILATLTFGQEFLGHGGAILGTETWSGPKADMFSNSDGRHFLGVLTVLDFQKAQAIEQDLLERLARESYRFSGVNALNGLELEVDFAPAANPSAGRAQLTLPKSLDVNGQAKAISDIEWDLNIDPVATPGVAVSVIGSGDRNWGDSADYRMPGIGPDGRPQVVTPDGDGPADGVLVRLGSFEHEGLQYDIKVDRPRGTATDHFLGVERLLLTGGNDTIEIGGRNGSFGEGWSHVDIQTYGGSDFLQINLGEDRGQQQVFRLSGDPIAPGYLKVHLQGEEQRVTFSAPAAAGTIQVAGQSISIAAELTAAQVAAAVATSLRGTSAWGVDSGREVQAQADGTLVLRFAAHETNVAPVEVNANNTDVGGVVETIHEQRSATVQVLAGDSLSSVAQKVQHAIQDGFDPEVHQVRQVRVDSRVDGGSVVLTVEVPYWAYKDAGQKLSDISFESGGTGVSASLQSSLERFETLHHLGLSYEDGWNYATRGVLANFTGASLNRGDERLESDGLQSYQSTDTNQRVARASISDSHGGIDTLEFSVASDNSLRDSGISLSLDGTLFRDTYRLSADGLGVVRNFQFNASTGIDLVWVNAVDNRPPATNLYDGAQSVGQVLGGRFNSAALHEVVLRGEGKSLQADLYQSTVASDATHYRYTFSSPAMDAGLRLQIKELGQEYRLTFNAATGAGDLQIAGQSIAISAGLSAQEVAQRVADALATSVGTGNGRGVSVEVDDTTTTASVVVRAGWGDATPVLVSPNVVTNATGVGGSYQSGFYSVDVSVESGSSASNIAAAVQSALEGEFEILRSQASGAAGSTRLNEINATTVGEIRTDGRDRLFLDSSITVTPLNGLALESSGLKFLQSELVTDNIITFDANPGQFSAFSLALNDREALDDGKTISFSPSQHTMQAVGYGGDDWGWYAAPVSPGSDELLLSSINRDYRWWDDDVSGSNGVAYYNGIVDKRGAGFDRLVENTTLQTVGARVTTLTENDDYVVQTSGSKANLLSFNGDRGADSFFYRVRNDDSNQYTRFSLGADDRSEDILDIDLSRADGRYGSAQWIFVNDVERGLDQIRLLSTDGLNVSGTRSIDGNGREVVHLRVVDHEMSVTPPREVANIQISFDGQRNSWGWEGTPTALTMGEISAYLGTSRSAFGEFSMVSTTSGNDEALILENSSPRGGPLLFGAGHDYVIAAEGDADVALGAGDDFVSIRSHGQQLFVSGGGGADTMGLSGGVMSDALGRLISTDWEFGSISVAAAQEFLRAKYPLTFTSAADAFEWDNGQLDRVMVATNRYDATTVYFQAEELSFSSGDRFSSGSFLPPIEESYDFRLDANQINATDPRRVTAVQNVFGRRGTEDTLTLNVNNVDEALKYVGTWLDSTTTVLTGFTGVLGGSHSLVIRAETAATKWFTTGRNYTSSQFNLVDVENIRLIDASGADVTIRVAGSNGFQSVEQAVARANRGDVIFVAEHRENDISAANGSRTSINMDKSVSVDAGLRVVFEEGPNRTVNPLKPTEVFKANLSESVKTGPVNLTGDLFDKHSDLRILEVLGTSNVDIIGSSLNDLIIGNRGNNTIKGRGGDDFLFGGFGSDILLGQSGNDILVGGSSGRIHGFSHTPDEGPLLLNDIEKFRQVSVSNGAQTATVADAILIDADHLFRTGDRIAYTFSEGTAATISTNGFASTALTSATPLFAIVEPAINSGGQVYLRLATSAADAFAGRGVFITSVGTAKTQALTLDSQIASPTQLAGNDFVVGGTGDDILVATGVTGSLFSPTIRDTLTLSGGSGDDRFDLFAATGQINIVGGSGQDTFHATRGFSETMSLSGAARVFDFSATQDLVRGAVDVDDLGEGFALSSELDRDGLKLSQLVSPPLPLVDGEGENGNYQEARESPNSTLYATHAFDGVSISLQDLINQHQAHTA